MTPIQGDWKIDAIGLPVSVLRKVCFDNARRLLVRSLPLPVLKAVRVKKDFRPDGRLDELVWRLPAPVRLECQLRDGVARPEISTTVRALWSDRYLYLGYECPFTERTTFSPPALTKERFGLWEKDVVEAFIGSDSNNLKHYFEFEVSPNGERIDLEIGGATKDLEWNSGFESGVKVDEKAKVWTAEMRIPLGALSSVTPTTGTRWRVNLYRHDIAHRVFLAWSPTTTATAHTPEKFGYLEFGE